MINISCDTSHCEKPLWNLILYNALIQTNRNSKLIYLVFDNVAVKTFPLQYKLECEHKIPTATANTRYMNCSKYWKI